MDQIWVDFRPTNSIIDQNESIDLKSILIDEFKWEIWITDLKTELGSYWFIHWVNLELAQS